MLEQQHTTETFNTSIQIFCMVWIQFGWARVIYLKWNIKPQATHGYLMLLLCLHDTSVFLTLDLMNTDSKMLTDDACPEIW